MATKTVILTRTFKTKDEYEAFVKGVEMSAAAFKKLSTVATNFILDEATKENDWRVRVEEIR